MVEFAVSLPLLIVFVVGIFDFSGAYTLKHKLANAARDGARAAAADPATDLGNGAGVPASVSDAFQVIHNNLIAEKINDCGMNASSGVKTALTWTYTANSPGPPPCKLIVKINRGYPFTQAAGGTAVYIIATQVTIQYDYNWHFNSVITVLVPTASYGGKLTFQTSAVALNEN